MGAAHAVPASAFVPVLGLIGLFTGIQMAAYLSDRARKVSFETVIPEYVNCPAMPKCAGDAGGIRACWIRAPVSRPAPESNDGHQQMPAASPARCCASMLPTRRRYPAGGVRHARPARKAINPKSPRAGQSGHARSPGASDFVAPIWPNCTGNWCIRGWCRATYANTPSASRWNTLPNRCC